jgi:hypothetical protein
MSETAEQSNRFNSIVEKAGKLLDSRAEHITLLESKVELQKSKIKLLEALLAKERGRTKGLSFGTIIKFPTKFLPAPNALQDGTILKVNKEYGIRLHISPHHTSDDSDGLAWWIMYKVYHNGKEKMLMAKYNKEGDKFYNIKGKRFYWKDMDKINWDYTYTKSSNNSTNTHLQGVEKTSVSSEDMSLLHTILKCSETLYTKFNTL